MLLLSLPCGCSEEETKERKDFKGGKASRSFDPERPEARAKAERGEHVASATEHSASLPFMPWKRIRQKAGMAVRDKDA